MPFGWHFHPELLMDLRVHTWLVFWSSGSRASISDAVNIVFCMFSTHSGEYTYNPVGTVRYTLRKISHSLEVKPYGLLTVILSQFNPYITFNFLLFFLCADLLTCLSCPSLVLRILQYWISAENSLNYSQTVSLCVLIFPIMTAVLYIIPLITRLLANTKKKPSHSMSFYNLFVTVQAFSVRFSLFAAFLFFSWPLMTTQPFAKTRNHRIYQKY